jgi:hypothetical protein
MLCRHHWMIHADALIPFVSDLVDETSQLAAHIADDHHL